jgi:hypothetical protein
MQEIDCRGREERPWPSNGVRILGHVGTGGAKVTENVRAASPGPLLKIGGSIGKLRPSSSQNCNCVHCSLSLQADWVRKGKSCLTSAPTQWLRYSYPKVAIPRVRSIGWDSDADRNGNVDGFQKSLYFYRYSYLPYLISKPKATFASLGQGAC